jgi:hypothetical protein
MKNKWLVISSVLVFGTIFSISVAAQDQGSARGNLGGVVYDSTKASVPGAQVTITGPIGSLTQTTTQDGAFLFSTLIPGNYSIKVQKTGFKVVSMKSAEVQINKTTSIEVILETGQVSETVEVSAAAMTVDTSASSVNTSLSDTLYENIPVQRGVASLFYLAPGVVSGLQTGNSNPAISGASGLENQYVADGVSINDPAFGGMGVWSRFYGALGTGINLSFVKEVQVKTAGFEPQYGEATGGVIQIVTKSGGTSTHGVLGGWFNTTAMQTPFANADDPQFAVQNLVGRHLHDSRYEADAELGGYVPLGSLKKHLFYFGTFNPTWQYQHWAPAAGSGLFTQYNGNAEERTLSKDYAGKLTFKINDSHTVESSIFGDPNTNNAAPYRTLNSDNTSANSKWDYGTRNWVVRYDGALTSTWLVDGAFTWTWNHFKEIPATDIYQVVDNTQLGTGQRGQFNAQGIGFLEPYDSNSKGYNADTSKIYHLFGQQHTFMIGALYRGPNYDDITTRSGPRVAVPLTNADNSGYLSASQLALIPAGSTQNFTFSLNLAPSSCTLCPFMSIPQVGGGTLDQRVLLVETRGTFSSGITHSTGKYYTGYVNDSWAMGKHATLNLGVRWEQQRINGTIVGANFHNMWDPRVSFVVDPKGDHKSKIYASFARLPFVVPLDAAIRSLSSENDLLGTSFAPQADATNHVVLNSFGTVNPIPDSGHVLDNAAGGVKIGTAVSAQSGAEPFQPNVRMEYNDEFVVGAEHEFKGGIYASVRYIDRRLKRVVEDFSGISIEAAFAGLPQDYVIGNPSATTDLLTNANEQTFGLGTAFAVPVDSMGNALPFTSANYPNAPAACFDKNGNGAPVVFNLQNTFGQILGSACFPSVNLNPWTDSKGNNLAAAKFGGEVIPDGKPDGFKNPNREYQAVEFEVNKPLSHNWMLLANWRIARVQGNYEGAFRNDNGQADPGITSLFDFTPGLLGTIAHQQDIGPLNSDRKHVVNVYTTYILDRSFAKGLVLGSGLRVQSGVPLTTIAAQQAYVNSGEVPIFGRGDLGRSPVTGTVDAHVEYPWKITEKMRLRLAFDAFNIANTKRPTLLNQNVDLQFGVLNSDFQKPLTTFFVPPFQSRASIKLEF